ncbi:MAG: hypothetical protein JXR78_09940 [Victivallales bacterium]|jgi:large subunit ribosomal protein L24|nr:hypothetical protein [Victivallales bacterium]
MSNKYHVKKGDKVVVNTGEWKNREAKILAILPKKDRVVLDIDGLTDEDRRRLGKRTIKKTQQNPNGGMVERNVSCHVSNVTKKED